MASGRTPIEVKLVKGTYMAYGSTYWQKMGHGTSAAQEDNRLALRASSTLCFR